MGGRKIGENKEKKDFLFILKAILS